MRVRKIAREGKVVIVCVKIYDNNIEDIKRHFKEKKNIAVSYIDGKRKLFRTFIVL